VKSQEHREGDAVVIFTAMLCFAAVTAVGAGLLAVLAHISVFEDHLGIAGWVLIAGAALISLMFLYRNRRPG
jgi:hypothetical protein